MKNLRPFVGLVFLFIPLIFSCKKESAQKEDLYFSSSYPKDSLDPIDTISAEPEWVNYHIDSGAHYNSLRSFELFPYDSLVFDFSFDSTAIYATSSTSNQADWNKLMGFSDCQSHHQTNSVRLVWRYTPGLGIEIGEYFYQGGERSYSALTAINIGDTINAAIYISHQQYHLRVGEKEFSRSRKCNNRQSSYWLYPYFGGDEPSPHDINIYVRHIFPTVEI